LNFRARILYPDKPNSNGQVIEVMARLRLLLLAILANDSGVVRGTDQSWHHCEDNRRVRISRGIFSLWLKKLK
jgi:hypothetical protein